MNKPPESPSTPPLRFGPRQEAELAKSDREFKLYMEVMEMTDITAMTGALQEGRSPFEFTDVVVLALLLNAVRVCLKGTFARGLQSPFPRARFLELAAQCVDKAEGDLAHVQHTFEKEIMQKRDN